MVRTMSFEKMLAQLLIKYKDKIKKEKENEGNTQCMQKKKNLKRYCKKMALK